MYNKTKGESADGNEEHMRQDPGRASCEGQRGDRTAWDQHTRISATGNRRTFFGKGVDQMAARTIAVQVTEELFGRLKAVVAWKGCKQKDFLISIIEKAVKEIEDEQENARRAKEIAASQQEAAEGAEEEPEGAEEEPEGNDEGEEPIEA